MNQIRRISHRIGGSPVEGTSGRIAPVYDPATGRQQAAVDLASEEEVDAAIDAARSAQQLWGEASLSRRASVMFAFRDLLVRRRDELAALVSSEHGKVRADALGEVARGLENVEFACGIPYILKGGHSSSASTGVDVWSLRQPVGVVAAITPFNFPVMVPLWMLAGALACGNAVVLKPSEKDPSASMLLAELVDDAGFPPGLCNVVNGDKVAVDRLLAHPGVDAVSFVGSSPVARHVYVAAANAHKRVQALGGAKNHMVVLPDADIDLAADAAVSAAFGSSGERCMAVSVIVAVGSVGDPLVEAIAARIPKVKVGPSSDAEADMGPLITAAHRDRVAQYVADGERDGATVVVDGRKTEVPADGFFLGMTLLDHVDGSMSVYRDEIFGPVLCVVRADDYEAAMELVNGNPYGNGAAIFTRDGGAARRFQLDVSCGMVGVNVPLPVPVAYYSFGGWKASLFGDSHVYGPEGVHFYTRGKVVTSRWPEPDTSTVDLGFPGTR